MPAPSKDLTWLKTLSQQDAAYVAGCTSRTLRDHPSVPRNPDGRTYDARQIAEWSALRVGSIALDDEDVERVLVLAAQIEAGIEASLPAVVGLLRGLISLHGPAVAVLIVQLLVDEWGGLVDTYPDVYAESSAADIRKAEDLARQLDADRRARDKLLVAVVCEDCGKLRRGRRWIIQKPPTGYVKQLSQCPACEKEATAGVQA